MTGNVPTPLSVLKFGVAWSLIAIVATLLAVVGVMCWDLHSRATWKTTATRRDKLRLYAQFVYHETRWYNGMKSALRIALATGLTSMAAFVFTTGLFAILCQA